MVSAAGAVVLGQGNVLSLPWQLQAWRFYSLPDGATGAGTIGRLNQGAIGEVRFVMGWIAQQIGRIGWHVDIDGERLDDAAAKELMRQVANEDSTTIIATNLIVAGELNYVALPPAAINEIYGNIWEATVGDTLPGDNDKRWLTVSVIDNLRQIIFSRANAEGINMRAIWAHPARPIAPDPPLRGVLDVLAEIEQLGDLSWSQNRSRIANMGILTVANDLQLGNTLPNGTGRIGQDLETVMNAPIADPRRTGASPIIFEAPMEYFTGALSNGARGLQWTKPDLETYTDTLESRMRFAIQRLAWGFPVAPEILLGMTATNRAVAFQIEESTYRAYVEPICDLVGKVYARALRAILPGEQRVDVKPDATVLLAKRHSVADAKDLYDRGIVKAAYVRRVAGVDEDDAATDEDLHRIVFLRKGTNEQHARENDPAEVAGNEPVRASGEYSLGALGHALEGALQMAQGQFIQRVGAAARTRLQRVPGTPAMELDPSVISNLRLPSFLGPDRLAELGVDVEQCARPVAQFLAEWWSTQAAGYAVDAPFPGPLEESTLELTNRFMDWCRRSATAWPAPESNGTVHAVLSHLYLPVPEEQGAA
jgi:hypothetical protein